jgi:hypothetical protein
MSLTVHEAEREARWRWGGVLGRGFARYTRELRLPFEVGIKRFKTIKIRGQGSSWEGAFANAVDLDNTARAHKHHGSSKKRAGAEQSERATTRPRSAPRKPLRAPGY